jgi:hypothetical protein
MRRGLVLLVGVASLSASVGQSIGATGTVREPEAYLRPSRTSDALPRQFRKAVDGSRVVDSRRIAAYRYGIRAALLYLVKATGGHLGRGMCLELITGSTAGGTCFASSVAGSLAAGGRVIGVEGRFFGGVAANDVARVVIVARGGRHAVRLTRDKGFIYDCGSVGCARGGGVEAVEAYGRDGALLSRTPWPTRTP